MEFIRRELPQLTRTIAERMKEFKNSKSHNMPFDNEDIKPFSLRWGKVSLPKEHSHYIDLPSLYYKNKFVATLGFRNKSGYVMINDEVKQESHNAIIARMLTVINASEHLNAVIREERNIIINELKKYIPCKRSVNHWGGYCVVRIKGISSNVVSGMMKDLFPRETFKQEVSGNVTSITGYRPQYNVSLPVMDIQHYGQEAAFSVNSKWVTVTEADLRSTLNACFKEYIFNIPINDLEDDFKERNKRSVIKCETKKIDKIEYI